MAATQSDRSAGKSKTYLVLVEPYSANFRYLELCQRRGLKTLVLAADPEECRKRERAYNQGLHQPLDTRIDLLVQCDTTKVPAMQQAIEPFRAEVAGVLTAKEEFLPLAVELGWRMGFDYAHPEDAVAHHLKSEMKRRFQQRGIPTARFFIARTLDQARRAWQDLGGDCMVKMVDAASSVNVFRVHTLEELESAWDTIINDRGDVKFQVPLTKEVVVEEFVRGRELSVEGYIQNDHVVCLNYCEKMTATNFVIVGHLIPAHVSPREDEILRRVAEQVVRAEGMRNSVFHVEIHLEGDIPHVIECTSRPPGMQSVDLMNRSYGFDLMDINIALAVGEQVSQRPVPAKKYFAMLALYSDREGRFERLEGLEELRRRDGLVHLNVEVSPGDRIEALTTFRHRYGVMILEDDTPEGILEKMRWARSHVRMAISNELIPEPKSL